MNDILLTPLRLSELEILIENSVKRGLSNMQPQPEVDRNLDIDGLREYLPGKPAKQTIYFWVSKRKIPFSKMGKRLVFRKSAIDRWLKSKGRKMVEEIEEEVDNQSGRE